MQTKDERQELILNRWEQLNYRALFLASTGFGKTITAIKGILRLKDRLLLLNGVIVVVPTTVLKLQWEERLTYYNLSSICKVVIINTAYKHSYNCSLLIIDEAHKVPSTEFRKCLETIKFDYILGLTATIERGDGEEHILLHKFPICDEITLKECLDNKWISEYAVYNLPVPLTYEEYNSYRKINNSFKYYTNRCTNYDFRSPFDCATYWLKEGNQEQKGFGAGFYRNMTLRKNLLMNNENKFLTTLAIISKYPDRLGLVFSESTEFADKLYNVDPSVILPIHYKIKQKEQEKQLNLFKQRLIPQRIISSCKSLVAGLDIPELSLGIIASASSSKIASIQSIGRILRVQPDKQAIIVNLYTPDYEDIKSQEVKWLINRQKGLNNINWINSIDEII